MATNNAAMGGDRYTKSVMVDLRKELVGKIAVLEAEQERLIKELNSSFDCDKFRRLNIVNQHLHVANSRRNGEWLKGDYPEYVTISKTIETICS